MRRVVKGDQLCRAMGRIFREFNDYIPRFSRPYHSQTTATSLLALLLYKILIEFQRHARTEIVSRFKESLSPLPLPPPSRFQPSFSPLFSQRPPPSLALNYSNMLEARVFVLFYFFFSFLFTYLRKYSKYSPEFSIRGKKY